MLVLVLALVLTVLTVVVHSLGSYLSINSVAWLWDKAIIGRHRPRIGLLMAWLVSMLLLTHLVEVGLWSFVYCWWGMLPDLSTALYYSLTSYTTVGYGDVLLAPSWRMLGPLEAMVGVLMLGWSTAMIVAALNRIYREVLNPP
jgi:hypothetical protein